MQVVSLSAVSERVHLYRKSSEESYDLCERYRQRSKSSSGEKCTVLVINHSALQSEPKYNICKHHYHAQIIMHLALAAFQQVHYQRYRPHARSARLQHTECAALSCGGCLPGRPPCAPLFRGTQPPPAAGRGPGCSRTAPMLSLVWHHEPPATIHTSNLSHLDYQHTLDMLHARLVLMICLGTIGAWGIPCI